MTPTSLDTWIGYYKNCRYNYFGKHMIGNPIDYTFNSQGFRGNEFINSDITVFGSSFSFGVGLPWENVWHQQLAKIINKTINVYSVAGYGISNNELIDLYYRYQPQNMTIIQLREESYTTKKYVLPDNVLVFRIEDSLKHPGQLTFTYKSFVDKAEDKTHPGVRTHLLWAKLLIKLWKL